MFFYSHTYKYTPFSTYINNEYLTKHTITPHRFNSETEALHQHPLHPQKGSESIERTDPNRFPKRYGSFSKGIRIPLTNGYGSFFLEFLFSFQNEPKEENKHLEPTIHAKDFSLIFNDKTATILLANRRFQGSPFSSYGIGSYYFSNIFLQYIW